MMRKFLIVAAVITSSQLSTTASGQTQDTTTLDVVVISANKYPNKTSLTGKVVTVITRQQLEHSGGKDLSQILTEQAGVYIGGANSNAGKDKSLYLRGADVRFTLITIDGVPIYDPSGIGSNFDIRNLSVDRVERIEILKGSQSTLYGSDAIAGVINIITKKSTSESFSANALVNYGSNQTVRAGTDINGKTGIVDYQLAYSFYDTKGINEAITDHSSVDRDGFRQNSIQAGLGLQVTKHVRIQPYFRFNKIDGDIDQGAFTDELDYTYTQKSYQAGVRNEFSFGKTKLNLLYNFNHIDRLYIDDSVKSRNGFDTYSRGSYRGAEHFIDGYVTVPLGRSSSKFIGGADLRTSTTDQEFYSVGFFGPYSPAPLQNKDQQQAGLYAAVNVNDKSGFNLELGNRLNIHSENSSKYVFNINPSYLLSKKYKLFANLSSGYRIPSLYQLFSEYGNKELEPESAITAEGGIQYFSADNRFMGRATGFTRRVKDVIFFYFNSTTFQSQYINQDRQEDYGAELELLFRPTGKTSIKAFYSFVDGKITTVQNRKDTTFFNLIRRPKHSGGINAGIKAGDKLFLSANFSWFGERKDSYYDASVFQVVNVTLKSYGLLDIYGEYSVYKNTIKIFVDLRNVTHSKYSETAGFNTLGFNGYGGVKVNF